MIGFDDLKNHWDKLSKCATWLISIVGLFVLSPPRLWPDTSSKMATSSPDQWLHFTQFVLAVIIGLFFVKSSSFEMRARLRRFSIFALVLGVVLFIAYQFLTVLWTCGYRGEVVVIGWTYSEIAQPHLGPSMTCSRMIALAHGETSDLWPAWQIVVRFVAIAATFSAAILSFSAAALAAIDYIRAGQSKPR